MWDHRLCVQTSSVCVAPGAWNNTDSAIAFYISKLSTIYTIYYVCCTLQWPPAVSSDPWSTAWSEQNICNNHLTFFRIIMGHWTSCLVLLVVLVDRSVFAAVPSIGTCPNVRGKERSERICSTNTQFYVYILVPETKIIRMFPKISQSRRRPLLGPSPGWKRLLAISHLRHY